MKDIEYLTQNPTLSGEEEVVARAGQGIEDPWAKEDQNPGILGLHPLDENGKVTPMYKKILKELGFTGKVKRYGVNIKPSKSIEEANIKWRAIQKQKKDENEIISNHIDEQLIIAENKKIKYLENLSELDSFRKTLDKKLSEFNHNKKPKSKRKSKHD